MNRIMIFLSVMLGIALGGMLLSGCSGGSRGGGGAVAAVTTPSMASGAPIPSGSSTVYAGLGLSASDSAFPAPLSTPRYITTRSGYANMSSGTVIWHPDNGAALHITAFDRDGNQDNSAAWLQLLEITTFDSQLRKNIVHSEDYRFARSVPISGGWYPHSATDWFDPQANPPLSGVFGLGLRSDFGVPIWLGDPDHPSQRKDAAHIFITPYPRVKIPENATMIQIRAKFILLNGALLYFGLDRWPSTTDSVTNQGQAQSIAEQVMLSQTYDSHALEERHFDISIKSPIHMLQRSDPNPPKRDPQLNEIQPIDGSVLGTP